MNILSGSRSGLIEANLVKLTVEGEQSQLAYAIGEMGPIVDAKGVALGAGVNPQLLIDFLRSKRPISPQVRHWLADMLDEGVVTNANLTLKRRRGRPKKNMLEYLDAVEAFVERRDAGDTYEVAIGRVIERIAITEGTLKKAVAVLEEGVRIRIATNRNP